MAETDARVAQINAVNAKVNEDGARAGAEAIKDRINVENDIEAGQPGDAARRLRDQWSRDRIVVRTLVKDTGCDWAKPLYVGKADVLSDSTVKGILAHNETSAPKVWLEAQIAISLPGDQCKPRGESAMPVDGACPHMKPKLTGMRCDH